MKLPSFLKPAPVTRGLDGTADHFGLSNGRRAFLAATIAGVCYGSYLILMDQAEKSDAQAAKRKDAEAKNREQASRNIWEQPDGPILIGSVFNVPCDPLSSDQSKKGYDIQFVQTESGTILMIDGSPFPLNAEDDMMFVGKIHVRITLSSIEKNGRKLIVKGAGPFGVKPGESQWYPETLLSACVRLGSGHEAAFDIQRENGDRMRGFLTVQKPISADDAVVDAGEASDEMK